MILQKDVVIEGGEGWLQDCFDRCTFTYDHVDIVTKQTAIFFLFLFVSFFLFLQHNEADMQV